MENKNLNNHGTEILSDDQLKDVTGGVATPQSQASYCARLNENECKAMPKMCIWLGGEPGCVSRLNPNSDNFNKIG